MLDTVADVPRQDEKDLEGQYRGSHASRIRPDVVDIAMVKHLSDSVREAAIFMSGLERLLEQENNEHTDAVENRAPDNARDPGVSIDPGPQRDVLQDQHNLRDDERTDGRRRKVEKRDSVFGQHERLEAHHGEEAGGKEERGRPRLF
ncbi:hypothetical protein [Rhizobium aouanii]|uniref:Uncharacterized protein n=1 Tax=Rhizobium aouanii TaxID=3118145 RepID=A0ABU8CU63_9HYPH